MQCGETTLVIGESSVLSSRETSFASGDACTYEIPSAVSIDKSQRFNLNISGENVAVTLYTGAVLIEAGQVSYSLANSYNASNWGANHWIVIKATGANPAYELTIEELVM